MIPITFNFISFLYNQGGSGEILQKCSYWNDSINLKEHMCTMVILYVLITRAYTVIQSFEETNNDFVFSFPFFLFLFLSFSNECHYKIRYTITVYQTNYICSFTRLHAHSFAIRFYNYCTKSIQLCTLFEFEMKLHDLLLLH